MSQTPTAPQPAPHSDPRNLHSMLYGRVGQLWVVWKIHSEVFGSEQNVQQMNEISPGVFREIQQALIHDMIRMVYALTDGPGGGKKKNLSMSRLVEAMASSYPASDAARKAKLASLDAAVVALRKHRNQNLMHFDFDTVRAKSTNLPTLRYSDLKAAVTLIGELMSDISVLFDGSNIAYEWTDTGNAEGVFSWLLSDWHRFAKLRQLANDPAVPDNVLREMVKSRSDRNDPPDPRRT